MYRFRWPDAVLIAALFLSLTFLTDSAAAFQKKNDAVDIETLTEHLQQLRNKFGKDHPKVVAIRKQIGLLQRLGSEVRESPEHQAILDNLTPMLIEEQTLLSKFGKAHPRVKEVRSRIDFTTKHLTDKLKRSANSSTKGDPHAAFLKLLPLLLREQELIAKHGAGHSSIVAVQQQIDSARKTLAATSTIKRVPGRLNTPTTAHRSPGVNDDLGKPERYSIQTINQQTVLVDGVTGQRWISRIASGKTQWILIPATGSTTVRDST